MLPFIAVPTTSGTGSECQSYALVSDDKTHVKMACGDSKALAKVGAFRSRIDGIPAQACRQPNRSGCAGPRCGNSGLHSTKSDFKYSFVGSLSIARSFDTLSHHGDGTPGGSKQYAAWGCLRGAGDREQHARSGSRLRQPTDCVL